MSIVQALQQAGPFQIMERLGFNGVLGTLRGADVNRGHSACVVAIAESDLEDEGAWTAFQQSFNLLVATPRSRMIRPLQCGREPGVVWAAYEFADGMHLGKAVRDMGLPTIGDALRLAAQTLEALHSLHGSHTTHRMLSPASIFVRTTGEVALHHCGWAPMAMSARGGPLNPSLISILPFLAPEVLAGAEVTEAADIYSLGANLYFLITGQPVLWGDSPEEIAQAIRERAPDMAPVLSAAPPEVADLLEELLDKDPEDRPLNFAALLSRINALADRMQAQEAAAPAPDTEKLSGLQTTGVSNDATVRLPPSPSAPPPIPPTLPPLEQIPQKAAASAGPPPPPPPPPPGAQDEDDHAGVSSAPLSAPPPPVSVEHPSKSRKPKGSGGPKVAVIAVVLILLVVAAGGAILLLGGGEKADAGTSSPSPNKKAGVPAGPTVAEKPAGKPTPAVAVPETPEGAPAESASRPPAPNRNAATKTALAKIGAAHKKFLADNGLWATKLSELRLSKDLAVDSWGTPIELRETYVVSAGADRKWDTGDDMWVEAQTGAAGP